MYEWGKVKKVLGNKIGLQVILEQYVRGNYLHQGLLHNHLGCHRLFNTANLFKSRITVSTLRSTENGNLKMNKMSLLQNASLIFSVKTIILAKKFVKPFSIISKLAFKLIEICHVVVCLSHFWKTFAHF